MSVPTNWDAAGQGIQDEIDAINTSQTPLLPLAQSTSASLASIPAASLDGKFITLVIAGISHGSTVKLFVNGTQFNAWGVSSAGSSFLNQITISWDSTNQNFQMVDVLAGGASPLSSFNPSTFTFSTDALNTVTSFAVFAI